MNLVVSDTLTEDDFVSFRDFFLASISKMYPSSTEVSANSIIASHRNNFDKNGYFTLRKKIWKVTKSNETHPVGFTVVSEKRGGSIKFGPTIIGEHARSQGIGSKFRVQVENIYGLLGYRKAYSTTHLDNIAALRYVLKIGYKIEIQLRDHYSAGIDEVVLGKDISHAPANTAYTAQTSLSDLEAPEFAVRYMKKYYDGIDSLFFTNIYKALSDKNILNEDFFVHKNKHLYFNEPKSQYAVVTPKRGWCAKLCPLILAGDTSSDTIFVNSIRQRYIESPIKKLYTFVPLDCWYEVQFLKKSGFILEGVIRAPYKQDVDLLVYSIFW